MHDHLIIHPSKVSQKDPKAPHSDGRGITKWLLGFIPDWQVTVEQIVNSQIENIYSNVMIC